METGRLLTIGRALALLAAATCGVAQAQTYEVVHTFGYPSGEPHGELVQAPDGSFYGTSARGGQFQMGSIFRMEPDGLGGYSIIDIHSFFGRDGSSPQAGLLRDTNGWFYGTTTIGGEFGAGTIFAMDPAGHITTLHSFDLVDGDTPMGRLVVGEDGFLYGTTTSDLSGSGGTVFRCDRSGNLTTVHSFTGPDGDRPLGGVVNGPAGSGTLYGTTSVGGVNLAGVLFRIEADGTYSKLYDFSGPDGNQPSGPLLLGSDGIFYGTTFLGGALASGTVFRLTTIGGVTTVADLSPDDAHGPNGALIEPEPGTLVGAARFGGSFSMGSAFRVTTAGEVAVLHSFEVTDGREPVGGLVLGADGKLYGTTLLTGPIGIGTAYRVDLNGNFELVGTMPQPDGAQCDADLYEGVDGKLYGTCALNGPTAGGTIFAIGPDDTYAVVHAFASGEGTYPQGALVEGSDGALYGTTTYQDLAGDGPGSVFRIDPGTLSFQTIHAFVPGDGQRPLTGLTRGSDDLLYGVNSGDDQTDKGKLFRVNNAGAFEKLWDFTGAEGQYPWSPVTQGSDGHFYGAAYFGGSASGTIYMFDDATGATLVHPMAPAEGQNPRSRLLEVSSGVFVGTAPNGGANGLGTLFQVTPAGAVTVLHDFGIDLDGANPYSGLLLASDGNLYGTTYAGGLYGLGTIYRRDAEGTVTTIHEFTSSEGVQPFAGLIQANDGNLYGTTDHGTVYRLVFPGGDPPSVLSIEPASGPAVGGRSLAVHGLHFSAFPSIILGMYDSSAIGVDSRTVLAVSHTLDPGTLNDLTIRNPDQQTSTLVNAFFADFLDVDSPHPFHDFVESIFRAGITAGCGNGNYCPDAVVTREQMAVFLLRAEHGSSYTPPQCTGIFTDVPCTPGIGFPDWIEQLYAEHVTGGCIAAPLQYCPGRAVTRAEMAVFLLKTEHGAAFVPDPCASLFADVPCPATPEFPFSDWIERLYTEQVTSGCALAPLRYCPDNPNLRGEMAVFLTKTFLP